MLIRADVKCYYCGHVSGQVEGDPDKPRRRWSFQPAAQLTSRDPPARNSLRCLRCGGPVFLDEIEAVRSRPFPVEHPAVRAAG